MAWRKTDRTSPSTIVTDNDAIRVLHLTDPHLFADKAGQLRGTETYSSLARVVDHYRSDSWQAQIAVVTGDIIQDDSAEAYQHFRELLLGVNLPVACIPGNHDVRALMRDALSDEPFSYCPDLHIGSWLLTSVDSCISGRAGGLVSDEELARLATAVSSSNAEHIAVLLHHPPATMGSRWLDSVGLDNADAVIEQLQSDPRIRAAIFGHVHQAYDKMHGAVRVIGTPSTCRQFKPGSVLFAVDDRPPGYRRLSLQPDGTIETELMWVNNA